MALKFLTHIWGWKCQNATPTVLIRSDPNFMIKKAVIRVCKVVNVSAICHKLKKMWTFEILTWVSKGKS